MRKLFAILALVAFGALAGCETSADDVCSDYSSGCPHCTIQSCCDAFPSVECWYKTSDGERYDNVNDALSHCGCT